VARLFTEVRGDQKIAPTMSSPPPSHKDPAPPARAPLELDSFYAICITRAK